MRTECGIAGGFKSEVQLGVQISDRPNVSEPSANIGCTSELNPPLIMLNDD